MKIGIFSTLFLSALIFLGAAFCAPAVQAQCAEGFYHCCDSTYGPVCDPIPSDCRPGGSGTLRTSCLDNEIIGSLICGSCGTPMRCCIAQAAPANGADNAGISGDLQPGWHTENYASAGMPGGSIYNIIRNLLFWLLAIFGFIGIIAFVVSGIMYLTSAGNEDRITKAKAAMKWALVGVIVGLVGLVILYAVDGMLKGNTTGGFF